MKNRIRLLLTSLASFLLLGFSGSAALAASPPADIQNSVCGGANNLTVSGTPGSCNESGNTATNFNDTLHTALNVFSVIVGIVAVVMIIIGGFKYITSGGNSEKVTSAKNTLVYAIVGLIIVALAQFIVRFVLAKSTGNG